MSVSGIQPKVSSYNIVYKLTYNNIPLIKAFAALMAAGADKLTQNENDDCLKSRTMYLLGKIYLPRKPLTLFDSSGLVLLQVKCH